MNARPIWYRMSSMRKRGEEHQPCPGSFARGLKVPVQFRSLLKASAIHTLQKGKVQGFARFAYDCSIPLWKDYDRTRLFRTTYAQIVWILYSFQEDDRIEINLIENSQESKWRVIVMNEGASNNRGQKDHRPNLTERRGESKKKETWDWNRERTRCEERENKREKEKTERNKWGENESKKAEWERQKEREKEKEGNW